MSSPQCKEQGRFFFLSYSSRNHNVPEKDGLPKPFWFLSNPDHLWYDLYAQMVLSMTELSMGYANR